MKDLLAPDDTRDALRKLGGLLFGLGMLMVAIRKESDYSDFVLFLIYLIPAAFLYGEGVFTDKFTGGIRPWQAVYSVFGLILVPFALGQFVEMLDGEFSGWNVVWIFAVTAGLAFYAGAVKGIRFQLLAGSIATIVFWSAFWNEVLADGIARDFGIYRGLLGILSILLLAGALYLWRTAPGARVTGTVVNDGGDQKVLEGLGAADRRRHLGRARVQPRDQLGRDLRHSPRDRLHGGRDRRALGRAAAADLARPGRTGHA